MEDKNIITDPDFWDCACELDYIHSKRVSYCEFCDCHRDNQPDSRAFEVQMRQQRYGQKKRSYQDVTTCDEPLINMALTQLCKIIAYDFEGELRRHKIIKEIEKTEDRLHMSLIKQYKKRRGNENENTDKTN